MQNEQTLQQMIREYESNMPPEIMELIKSFDWKKEMRTIVNQNQLMISTGADIEESVYLMILGVIQVADLYERLTDTHEMPDDKARKVIEEIEMLIFNPLHQKLMELEKKESMQNVAVGKASVSSGGTLTRDDILAEIEKEPEAIITIKKPTMPSAGGGVVVEDKGIRKPFSISFTKEIEMEEPRLDQPAPVVPITGIQKDSVSTGLQKPTVMQAPSEPVVVNPHVTDPYREPIE